MNFINQTGKKNQATTGDNSPIISRSKITLRYLKNGGWFLTGFLLPILTGIILEMFKKGISSDFLNKILDIFK